MRVRLEQPEAAIENQELGVGCNEDSIAMKGDSPQAAVTATALEIDVRAVPIELELRRRRLQVDQVQASVTFAQICAPDHRGGEHAGQSVR